MRNQVDDLAHNVDKYASKRQGQAAEAERAAMETKLAQVRDDRVGARKAPGIRLSWKKF